MYSPVYSPSHSPPSRQDRLWLRKFQDVAFPHSTRAARPRQPGVTATNHPCPAIHSRALPRPGGFAIPLPRGHVAEWLRRGLQILVRGFDSLRGLQISSIGASFGGDGQPFPPLDVQAPAQLIAGGAPFSFYSAHGKGSGRPVGNRP